MLRYINERFQPLNSTETPGEARIKLPFSSIRWSSLREMTVSIWSYSWCHFFFWGYFEVSVVYLFISIHIIKLINCNEKKNKKTFFVCCISDPFQKSISRYPTLQLNLHSMYKVLHAWVYFSSAATTQLIRCPLHSTNKRGGFYISEVALRCQTLIYYVRFTWEAGLPRCIFSLGIPGAALRHRNDFSQASRECYLESCSWCHKLFGD